MGHQKIHGAIVGLGFRAGFIPIGQGCRLLPRRRPAASVLEGKKDSMARMWPGTLVLVALLACAAVARGQEYRATLTGLVSDAQGLALPGVAVTATHVETGTTHQAVTEGSGAYTFAQLSPGDYTVVAQLEGFVRLVRERVRVPSGQRVTLDLTLEVGSLTESVTVRAEAALLATGTASVGVVVEAAQIDNLPMSGRAPSSLIKLSAGVLDQTSPVANTRPFDNSGTSSFSMGGGQNRTNELLLDGGPNMSADRRISYNPPADIVQEIKIETFQSDASYGNSAAGTVNIVTKSGTNQFRGGAGFYTQPSSLSGTTFFTKRAGRDEPPFTYKQGGATAGGPVVIPGLIDGKNRLFWIVSYDNIRDSYVTPVTTTVPTAAMRNGDFSELLPLGEVYRIYDPLTGVAEGVRRRRQAFNDNRIPADRINPVARAYLNYYPLPNQPGRSDGTGNYLSPTTRSDTYDSLMGRTDINFDARNRLMVKWYGNDRVERKGNLFGNIGTGAILPRRNSGALGDYVHILNSRTTVNSRFGWTRFSDHETRESTGFDIASIGFPSSVAAASINPVLPMIAFSDSTSALGPTGGNVAGAGFSAVFDSYQWFTSATSARGKHTLKFGADLRLLRETSINYGNSAGSYTFGPNWTVGPLDNAAAAPNGAAVVDQFDRRLGWIRTATTAGPDGVDAKARELRAAAGATPTKEQAEDVQFLQDLSAKLRKATIDDPIGLAERQHIAPVRPIVVDTPDALSAGVRDRVALMKALPPELNPNGKMLKPEDVKAIERKIAMGGEAAVDTVKALVAGAGRDAPALMREIGGTAPELAQAGLLMASGGSRQAARDIIAAVVARGLPGGQKPVEVDHGTFRKIWVEKIGDSLVYNPSDRQRIEKAARAIASTRIQGLADPKSADAQTVYGQAIEEAFGGQRLDGQAVGGLGRVKTGWFSSAPVPLPPDVKSDRFPDALAAIRDDDLQSLPVPPIPGTRAAQVRNARPVAVPGGYRFALGDPAGQDPKWIQGQDGKPFVLPWDEIKSRLRERAPGAFIGGR